MSLDTLGKLATTVGVLLPVAGAAFRELAFWASGRVPLGVGAATPLPHLMSIGAGVMLPGLLAGLYMAWFIREPERFASPSPSTTRLRDRRFFQAFRVFIALSALVIVPLAVISAGIAALVPLAAGAALGRFANRLTGPDSRAIPLPRLVGIVLVATGLLTFTSALGPTTAATYVAQVAFAGDLGLSDGLYSVLGDDGSGTWLLSCNANAAATRVESSRIKSLTVTPLGSAPSSPTLSEFIPRLWDAVQSMGPRGFVQRCP